ncbi:dihydrodipicolinate synthase family protein [Acinetobacter baumannii]|uniref:dihydrodipicolinate synthase family protein n=1 Tax=Acinetobacter baumannii TaxID=470 RepID=UPI0018FFEE96|nr:dihydrodipicolinate synthase family protein [Acinetobacter baumannii]MBJ9493362.1 dihydrodipicolinate synthase family protein [Acinetobacter baumannii]MCT9183641.1 dihydrodipicolinate synthase family protein [Acinetobacter baumannii]MCT9224279.1 dihydrodipicolinate synthase family protein [Acinetobacter baumannii]MCT9276140.1 dihydrodipicolinate synthase family protein [Acinetobacter baumannii]
MKILLPLHNGNLEQYELKYAEAPFASPVKGSMNRIAYAAAHVVVNPTQPGNPWDETISIDWDKTLAFREYLWSLGFKVAEAMDTAQRGMGLGWKESAELITRSAAHAKTIPGAELSCGVGTDQLLVTKETTLNDVLSAYREQFEVVNNAGVSAILMASRALCATAKSAADYENVYTTLLNEAKDKVILHWLGEAFDPNLHGYWGSTDVPTAMDTVLSIINKNVDKVDGIKISLLEAKWEIELRSRLPEGVKLYTGDDFNFGELIAGDGERFSHALLGIFDPIAPVAAHALAALADGNTQRYEEIMQPTVQLSREIFCAPTRYYKAGVVFLAWLNGHQDHFSMLGGMQSARSLNHYCEVFRLADQAGALIKPDLAVERMKQFIAVNGGITG